METMVLGVEREAPGRLALQLIHLFQITCWAERKPSESLSTIQKLL